MPSFQTSPGTRDILPPEAGRWRAFTARFAATVEPAGYGHVIPPMFEDIGVFSRLGDHTDVVTKEMYDFVDKGERHVALRPEQTASICRAYAQHRPVAPWKVWYSGPNFRYEKPQAGRYRQFDQVGVEVLGADDALLDAEVVALAWRFFVSLGLQRVELVVNSLGDAGDRAAYAGALRDHFGRRSAELAPETKETLARNPLRVLDSKRETDAAALADAPPMGEFLSDGARGHFARFTAGLDALGVPFRVDERLVRGLDYYRRTTFEFVASSLEGAQNAVGGGGRYNGLVEDLGGPATGGVGFALGVDRTLLACDAEGVFPAETGSVDVFVVDTSDGTAALRITDVLRASGWSADRACDGRSMKSQMKSADRSGARLAVIVGPDEAASGTCTVRDMGDSTQATISQDALAAHVAGLIGPGTPRRTQ
ncbi:MAG: histidine--tRNA ligase [Acidimicrobiales bacterium]